MALFPKKDHRVKVPLGGFDSLLLLIAVRVASSLSIEPGVYTFTA